MADAILSTPGKTCTGCKSFKKIDDFGLCMGYRRSACKQCRQEECAKWRSNNPTYHLGYYEANAESEKGRRKKDKKLYYQKNRELINQRSLDWAKNNPARASARTMKRLAAARQATPAWANLENIASFYQLAVQLSIERGEKFHVDHQVPLTSHLVCGLHVESNLQVIPARENLEKSNRTWPDMP